LRLGSPVPPSAELEINFVGEVKRFGSVQHDRDAILAVA
jgi:hypothetical protein